MRVRRSCFSYDTFSQNFRRPISFEPIGTLIELTNKIQHNLLRRTNTAPPLYPLSCCCCFCSKNTWRKKKWVWQSVLVRTVVVFIFWNSVFYLTHGVKSFFIHLVDNLWRAATLRDTFEGTWKNISATIKAGKSHFFTTDSGRCFCFLLAEFFAFIATRLCLAFCSQKKSWLVQLRFRPADNYLDGRLLTMDLWLFTLWNVRESSGPGWLLLSSSL